MKKNHLSERLLALLVCVFAWVGVNAAVTVTTDDNGYTVVTVTGNAGQLSDNVLAEGTTSTVKDLVSGKTKLKLVGSFNNDPDFNKLKSWCSPTHLDLSEAIIPDANDETGEGGLQMPSEWQNYLVSIILPKDQNFTCVPEKFCVEFKKLSSVTFQNQITGIGKNAFQMSEGSNGSSLTSITLPPNLKNIWDCAFQRTVLQSISIPGSVEYIGYQAFSTDNSLGSIVFESSDPSHQMLIKGEAFFNSKNILDVYVETTAKITCENGAFDFDTTYGNTNPDARTATLHFPESVASHYANLSHRLTLEEARDPGLFHNWLLAHSKYAKPESVEGGHGSGNGWWEFINNGPTKDPDDPNPDPTYVSKKFLTTWCDMKNDRLVPEGVKAYIVTGIDSDKKEVSLTRIFAIPRGTGVILYGQTNSRTKEGTPTLSMSLCTIDNSMPLRRDYWTQLEAGDHEELKNLLMPTGTDGIIGIKPYDDVVENGYTMRYRNFGMGRFRSTGLYNSYIAQDRNLISNFVGFFRLQQGDLPGGKAYLRLRATEYTDGEGAEAIIIGDLQEALTNDNKRIKSYQVEYDKKEGYVVGPDKSGYWKTGASADPNMEWEDDSNWGDRSKNNFNGFEAKFSGETFFEIVEEENGVATLILSTPSVENDNNDGYYTLQGVKVSNPQHGVYIKNGKKIIK